MLYMVSTCYKAWVMFLNSVLWELEAVTILAQQNSYSLVEESISRQSDKGFPPAYGQMKAFEIAKAPPLTLF